MDVVGKINASEGIVIGSSRKLKSNIEELKSEDAIKTLLALSPVTYKYKTDPKEERVGFIAEDVPELIAINNREGLSTMDIVAVLTKVVQEQQKMIAELSKQRMVARSPENASLVEYPLF